MRVLLIISICIFPFISKAQDRIDPPFDHLQNVANVLVITGPESDPLYFEQLDILSRSRNFLDRNDFAVIHYEDRSVQSIKDMAPIEYKGRILNERDEQRYMQSLLRTDDDVFSVVLVLKSGEVYQVWKRVVTPRDVAIALEQARGRTF